MFVRGAWLPGCGNKMNTVFRSNCQMIYYRTGGQGYTGGPQAEAVEGNSGALSSIK